MIAITGASGFLGSHLVRALIATNREFICLVRANSPRRSRLELCAENLRLVSFDDPSSLEHGLQGCSTVIHMLGLINGDEKQLRQANVEYLSNMVKAAKARGIQKFILISSVAAGMRHGAYGESKFAGEEQLRASGLPHTILRPAWIYGAGDTNNTELILRTLRRWPVIPLLGGGDFKIQPVYVRDVVSLILQAIAKPAEGGVFNVAGAEQIPLKEILTIFASLLKRRPLFFPIPLKPVQSLIRIFIRIFPDTKLPVKQILELDKHEAFDISQTRQQFRFEPVRFTEGARLLFEDLACAG